MPVSVNRGQYGVYQWDGATWQTVVPPTITSAIKSPYTASNHLKVVKNGAQAGFYVDGTYLTSITSALSGTSVPVGLQVRRYYDVIPFTGLFDNFLLKGTSTK